MKKLLLLALVAFIGINAQAQGKPEVITEQPAGTETVYKRVSGKMFFVICLVINNKYTKNNPLFGLLLKLF